ncbi:electron transfer flavoprotein alpha subunit [Dehalogenimonas sp. WBC-2]|nr:electron transfer flavoprotein alpha subunit [Dehalogenimonas sp. WBC-2]
MNHNTGILVITEARESALVSTSSELFGVAQRINAETGDQVSALVIGTGAKKAAMETGRFGAKKAFFAELLDLHSDSVTATIAQLASDIKPRFILIIENDLGRDVAPLLSASLQSAAVTDAVAVSFNNQELIITRQVYGGNALVDFIIESEPQIITLRPKAFGPMAGTDGLQAEITEITPVTVSRIRIIERIVSKEPGVRLEDAKIVVGGGRGIGGPDGFSQLKELADLLGGSVGASRPPCDQGWWPENGQIGITGKIIAPDLYVAVGISGSSQHLSGVSGAKTIIAINKDAEANIFKAATYGIIEDWKKVIPACVAKLKELTKS